MKRRLLALLVALGLVTGLLVAMAGSASANPCFIQNSDVAFAEANTQTVCVFNVTQVGIGQANVSDTTGIGGSQSNSATVTNTTTQNVGDITLTQSFP